MNEKEKKPKWVYCLSRCKKIILLLVVCCVVIGGLTPTIDSIIISDNDKVIKDNNTEPDEDENKKTSYDNSNLYVYFDWDPKYPDPGEEVTFYSRSYALYGHIYSCTWYFPDGYTAHGHTATYTFNKKGTYEVRLHAKAYIDGSFVWAFKTDYVKVGKDPFPRITVSPEDPSPGEQVTLDASDSKDPDGEIVSYKWSYYDAENPLNVIEIGTEKTINYAWSEQGIYNIILYIEDDKGNNNTYEKIIHVSILKINCAPNFSRGLEFDIGNYGDIRANSISWNLKIYKYSKISIFSRKVYEKGGNIEFLEPESSQRIEINNVKRKIIKIELVITAEADNAVQVSKTFYGLIFGKYIYLSKKDFVNPYSILLLMGLGVAALIALLTSTISAG